MFNRIYESLFEGSMVGSGALSFAVWSYVLGKMKPDRKTMEFYVELNPILLAAILGEESGSVASVIEEFCGEDKNSRTKEEQGRRLVREGQFSYRVVNGKRYNDLKSYEHRREYQRVKQAEYRQKKKKVSALPNERAAIAAAERGDQKTADTLTQERRPSRAVAVVPAPEEVEDNNGEPPTEYVP